MLAFEKLPYRGHRMERRRAAQGGERPDGGVERCLHAAFGASKRGHAKRHQLPLQAPQVVAPQGEVLGEIEGAGLELRTRKTWPPTRECLFAAPNDILAQRGQLGQEPSRTRLRVLVGMHSVLSRPFAWVG